MHLPETIGPYRIQGMLGQGAMGVVFRARHHQTGRTAAVKIVPAPQARNFQNLRREIHALAQIRHPGVVRILTDGVHEGLPWYAMELLEGETLAQHLDRLLGHRSKSRSTRPSAIEAIWDGTFTPDPADGDAGQDDPPLLRIRDADQYLAHVLALVHALCSPLGFLHGEGIVHRDIKPGNILIRPDGTPVILDFGLASRFAAGEHREALQLSGELVGTAAYMAPEQIRGRLVDARADLYSLGCIFYELLTGLPPFTGSSATKILQKHLRSEPQPPSRIFGDFPRELESVVLRLLCKRPRDRLGYAEDVAAELVRLGVPVPDDRGPRARAYLYRPGMIGRKAQLDRLEASLELPEGRPGELILIGGESGVGKTRLAQATTRLAKIRKLDVFTAQAPSRGTGRALESFLPLLQALSDRCHELGQAESHRIFGESASILAPYEPALARLPGITVAAEPAELPPGAARLRLFHALAETLSEFSSGQAALIVLDDLQWADELSLGFLGFLVRSERLSHLRVVILGLYRTDEPSERLESLLSSSSTQSLLLPRLTEREVGRVVQDMLALSATPPLFSEFLARRSEGNPFQVAEYLRVAVEEGLLWRNSSGAWQVGSENGGRATLDQYEALPLPRSVRELMARRLEGLLESCQGLVELAAVVGRPVTALRLWRLSRFQASDLFDAMSEALRRSILVELDGRLHFSHEQLRRATYQRIPTPRRIELHRSVALDLDRLPIERRQEELTDLAEHWERAEAWDKARQAYLEAARRERSLYAHDEAEAAYRAAIRLSPEISALRFTARFELARSVLQLRGQGEEAFEEMQLALADARELGDRRSVVEVRQGLGSVLVDIGRLDEAEREVSEALSLAQELGDRHLEGDVLADLGALEYTRGRFERAGDLLESAKAILSEVGDRKAEADLFGRLANLHYSRRRLDQALTLYERTLAILRELGDRRGEGLTLGNIANVERARGRYGVVRRVTEQALEILREVGFRRVEGNNLGSLGFLNYLQGRFDEAEELFLQSIQINREVGDRRFHGINLIYLARIDFLRGREVKARQKLMEARTRLAEVGDRRFEAMAIAALAELHHSWGRIELARELCVQVLEIRRDLGESAIDSSVLGSLATMTRQSGGDPGKARWLLDEARAQLADDGPTDDRASLECEAVHQALAAGNSGRSALARAERLASELDLEPQSLVKQALARAREAQAAFEAGRLLLYGEVPASLPPGLLRWLSRP